MFEFLPKMAKHKFASISLTVRDRAISSKWRPFCIFEFLPKMEKHKFASLSLTMQDRAISPKFQTTRYLRNVLLPI